MQVRGPTVVYSASHSIAVYSLSTFKQNRVINSAAAWRDILLKIIINYEKALDLRSATNSNGGIYFYIVNYLRAPPPPAPREGEGGGITTGQGNLSVLRLTHHPLRFDLSTERALRIHYCRPTSLVQWAFSCYPGLSRPRQNLLLFTSFIKETLL